jgi:hypothetical protein
MMNDQIKEFVEKNREEFDHLEAPAFDLERLKRRNQQVPQHKGKSISIFNRSKWLIAASVAIAVAALWLFSYRQRQINPTPQISQQKPIVVSDKLNKNLVIPLQQDTQDVINQAIKTVSIKKNKPETGKKIYQNNHNDTYTALKDSSSASVRLLAILEIEKTDRINNKILDMLSETLNHDRNTNVRLAALGVLQKYSTDSHTSALLVRSLNKQDDPIVQLGLLGVLGKMKNVKIDEKLYALANSPETFTAVRDEAYNILLNQNKL